MKSLVDKLEGTMAGAIASVAVPLGVGVSRSGVRLPRRKRKRLKKRNGVVSVEPVEETLSGFHGKKEYGYGKGKKIYSYRNCPDGMDFDQWTGRCVDKIKTALLSGADPAMVFWKMVKMKKWERAQEALGFVRVDRSDRKLREKKSMMGDLLDQMVWDFKAHSKKMITDVAKDLMKSLGKKV